MKKSKDASPMKEVRPGVFIGKTDVGRYPTGEDYYTPSNRGELLRKYAEEKRARTKCKS